MFTVGSRRHPAARMWSAAFALLAVLVALMLGAPPAAPAAPAPAALFAAGLTRPAGGVWMGTHFWSADQAGPICRLDIPSGGAPVGGFNQSTCLNGQTGTREQTLAFIRAAGQPAFDAATNALYVPDYTQKGAGVWRFTFDPISETIVPLSGIVLVRNAPLGGVRPTAVTLGPDGALYVGAAGDGGIRRIANPAGPLNGQVVQVIGGSLLGHAVNGVAFLGGDLYLAEADGLTVIRNAATCQSGCKATPVPGTAGGPAMAVASNGVALTFVQGSSVLRYSLKTQTTTVFSSGGTLPAGYTANTLNCAVGACTYTFAPAGPNGLTFDPAGNLYIGEDPGEAAGAQFQARIWQIPALPPPTITARPASPTNQAPTFAFAHPDPAVAFECSFVPSGTVDTFAACASPQSYPALPDGDYTFRVRAFDSSGGVSAAVGTSVRLDTTPPIVAFSSPVRTPTNVNTPSFAFVANEAATFQCALTASGAADAFAPCTSPASYGPLPDGAYTFKALATDLAGNVSPATLATLTIDTVAPTVTISGAPANPSNGTVPTFAFGANEAATFECALTATGAADTFAACASPASFGPLPDGAYSFKVRGTDLAGNVSAIASSALAIDTVPPAVSLTQAPPSPATGPSVGFAFASEAGAAFRCSLVPQGAPAVFAPCVSPATYAVQQGTTYAFAVTATDLAGNTSAPIVYAFQVAAPPTVAVADLAVAMTATPNPAQVGANLTYRVQVTNNGPATATGVTLTDPLPAGATFVSAIPGNGTCAVVARIVRCELGILAPGVTNSVTLTVKPGAAGTLVNTATVAAAESDPATANNAAALAITVNPVATTTADMQVTGFASTGSPARGATFTYTWQVKNNSGQTASGVTLTDQLPGPLGAPSITVVSTQDPCVYDGATDTVTCALGTLAVGQQATVTLTVQAPAIAGSIANTATVAFNGTDTNQANNAFTVTTQVK